MKPVRFLGDWRKCLLAFPVSARKRAGQQLQRIQRGLEGNDAKSLGNLGPGVLELRVWDGSGTYRVVYVARFAEAVYIVHAFQKKTQATAKPDVDLIRQRMQELRRARDQA